MDITLKMVDDNGRLITDEDYPVFVDWSNDFNKDTAGQAEVIYCLKQFIALAELVGEKEIDSYKEALEKISRYAKEHLFNPEKNLFVTTGDEYNLGSQVWMVLAHVMSDEENKKMIVEGYAIVFNEETLIGTEEHGFTEVIDAQALKETNMKDVPFKYNHNDSTLIIARTRNGSLSLEVDEKGLKIHAELIDTTSNRDIFKCIEAGLLDKMSFAFTVKSQSWDKSGKLPKRTITGIDRLFDVSVVDLPAYDQTSIQASARSLELADAELKALDDAENLERRKVIAKRIKIKTKN